jgi:branched-chain amino acid transport system permease protein
MVQAVIDGILSGALYALIGMGMALVFGVMRIVNFAHGAFLMVGMYITFLLFQEAGVNPYYGFLLAGAGLFLLGYVVYRLLERVRQESHFRQILFTSGISLILIDLARVIFSANYRQINLPMLTKNIHFAGVTVNAPRLFSFGIAVGCISLLYLFVVRAPAGRAVRAVAQNREVAPLVGINVNRIQALAFAMGAAAAGISGGLLLPVLYLYPTVGEEFTLKAFVMVVLGGMGSIIGAAVGGLVLGIAESLTSLFWGQQWAVLVDFLIFLFVLFIRPSGIFGSQRA